MINGEIRTGSDLTPYFRKEAALKRRCPNCGAMLEVVQRVGDDSNGGYRCWSCRWYKLERNPDTEYNDTQEWLKTNNLLFKGFMSHREALEFVHPDWRRMLPGEGMRLRRNEEQQKTQAPKRCRFLTPEFDKKS